MRDADPEDVFGWRASELLPRPIPYRFRLLDPEERGRRGRAAIRLWLLGCSVRSAWLFAMSDDVDQSDHVGCGRMSRVDDKRLPGQVLRRRLAEVASRRR
jgi:hypothetical protein